MSKMNLDKLKANRTVKDSVFRDLFSEKEYLLQLYQSLHPEDKTSTEEDLEYVTLEQVLVRIEPLLCKGSYKNAQSAFLGTMIWAFW